MTTMPISEARDHLSELVDEAVATHMRITLTRYGQPAVVMMAVEDLEGLLETLDLLSTPGAREDIEEGAEYDEREANGLPPIAWPPLRTASRDVPARTGE